MYQMRLFLCVVAVMMSGFVVSNDRVQPSQSNAALTNLALSSVVFRQQEELSALRQEVSRSRQEMRDLQQEIKELRSEFSQFKNLYFKRF